MANEKKGKEKQEESSWVLDKLSIVTDNLETYQGRDTVITLTHYIALIISDFCLFFSLPCARLSDNFVNMYIALSNCRVMLRLFDDCNAIRELYRYLKSAEKARAHSYLKWLTIVNLTFWVLYNPVEHLGWLSELRIINSDENRWWFYTNLAWAGGLLTSVLLNLRLVALYFQQAETKAKREDDPKYKSVDIISYSDMKNSLLIAFRDACDFVIAVHYLPQNYLWGTMLQHYQIGILGVSSSICRVHTYVVNKQ